MVIPEEHLPESHQGISIVIIYLELFLEDFVGPLDPSGWVLKVLLRLTLIFSL
jgi:hypothetical protein